MPTANSQLKRRMKFAPKMGRELRAEFLSVQVNAGPRTLSPRTLEKIRTELERLSMSSNPAVTRFVGQMRSRYSELRVA